MLSTGIKWRTVKACVAFSLTCKQRFHSVWNVDCGMAKTKYVDNNKYIKNTVTSFVHRFVHHKLLIPQFNFTNVVAFFHFFSFSLFPPSGRQNVMREMYAGKINKIPLQVTQTDLHEWGLQTLPALFIYIWCAHSTETTSTAATTANRDQTYTGHKSIQTFANKSLESEIHANTSDQCASVAHIAQLSRTSSSSYTHYSLNMHLPSDIQ